MTVATMTSPTGLDCIFNLSILTVAMLVLEPGVTIFGQEHICYQVTLVLDKCMALVLLNL